MPDPNLLPQLANDPTVQRIGGDLLDGFIRFLAEKGLGKAASLVRRWFRGRFGEGDDAEAEMAVERLWSFTKDLDERLRTLERERSIPQDRIASQLDKPEIAAALQDAFDASVETDDPLRREALADLVADRLLAPEESLWSIATRNAIAKMRDLNSRHLRQVALILLMNIDPMYDRQVPAQNPGPEEKYYFDWLKTYVEPFLDTPTPDMDLRHLRALGIVAYDQTTGMFDRLSLGTPRILTATAAQFTYCPISREPLVLRIRERANPEDGTKIPLQLCELTPAGIAIGQAVARRVVHLPADFSDMDA